MNELNVIELESTAVQSLTPMSLINMAVSQGADVDKLKQLMDLQERWEANEARKAYVAAMTAFKADPPEIYKTKLVAFGNTRYKHAIIGDVNAIIIEGLTKHGLSHRWEVDQSNGITVNCIITHAMGHSESTKMSAPADASGGKNNIQAIASTVTYLQRYTLLAATGIATQDMPDDDAMSGVKKPIVTKAEQVRQQISPEKDYTADINSAKTLDELGKVWKSIPIPNKAEYEALKDARKYTLEKSKAEYFDPTDLNSQAGASYVEDDPL